MHRLMIASVLCAALGGCASSRNDLVESGQLSLQPAAPTPLAHAPDVYEHNGTLVVEGQLDPSECVKGGHVNVRVVASDGTLVYDSNVPYRSSSAQSQAGPKGIDRGSRPPTEGHAFYSARFPGLPPKGSVVRVRCDPQP